MWYIVKIIPNSGNKLPGYPGNRSTSSYIIAETYEGGGRFMKTIKKETITENSNRTPIPDPTAIFDFFGKLPESESAFLKELIDEGGIDVEKTIGQIARWEKAVNQFYPAVREETPLVSLFFACHDAVGDSLPDMDEKNQLLQMKLVDFDFLNKLQQTFSNMETSIFLAACGHAGIRAAASKRFQVWPELSYYSVLPQAGKGGKGEVIDICDSRLTTGFFCKLFVDEGPDTEGTPPVPMREAEVAEIRRGYYRLHNYA